jgi:hypothetical protein
VIPKFRIKNPVKSAEPSSIAKRINKSRETMLR